MAYELSDIYVKVGMDMSGFQRGAKNLHQSFDKIQRSVSKTTSGFKKAAVGLTALGYASSKGVGYFAKYERSLSRIQLLGDATADTMDNVRDVVKKMGATTEFSASQAAKGVELLTMGGLKLEKSMAALPHVINLATTSQTDMARAADIATNVMGQYSLGAKELVRVNDALAKVQLTSNTNVLQAATAFEYAGTTAATMGLEIEELAGWIGIMAEKGIKGQRAGRMFRNVLLSLNDPTDEAQKIFQKYNIELEKAPGVLRDAGDIIKDLSTKITNQGDRMKILNKETADVNKVFQAYANGTLPEYIQQIEEADGVSTNFAQTLRQDIKGEIDTLVATIESVGIAVWEKYADEIEESIESITNTIRSHRQDVVEMADAINNAIKGVASFDPEASSLGFVYDRLKEMVGLFNSMPSEVAGSSGIGIVGAMLFGLKGGALLGGGAFLIGEFKDFFKGIDYLKRGLITEGEFYSDVEKVFEDALKRADELQKTASQSGTTIEKMAAKIEVLTKELAALEEKRDSALTKRSLDPEIASEIKRIESLLESYDDVYKKLIEIKTNASPEIIFSVPGQALDFVKEYEKYGGLIAESIHNIGKAWTSVTGTESWSSKVEELWLEYKELNKQVGLSERALDLQKAAVYKNEKGYKELVKIINKYHDALSKQKYDEVIAGLEEQRKQLLMTDEQWFKYQAVLKAGESITEEQKQQIYDLADSVYDLKEAVEEWNAVEWTPAGIGPDDIAGEDDKWASSLTDSYKKAYEKINKQYEESQKTQTEIQLDALDERFENAIKYAEAEGEDVNELTEKHAELRKQILLNKNEETTSEMIKQWNHVTENIHDALADTFADMFDEGLDSWEDFADSIVDIMLSAFAEMAAYDVMSFLDLDVGDGVGISDLVSGVSDIFSGDSSFISSLTDLFGSDSSFLSSLGELFGGATESGTGSTSLAGLGSAAGGISAAALLWGVGSGAIGDLFEGSSGEPKIYIDTAQYYSEEVETNAKPGSTMMESVFGESHMVYTQDPESYILGEDAGELDYKYPKLEDFDISLGDRGVEDDATEAIREALNEYLLLFDDALDTVDVAGIIEDTDIEGRIDPSDSVEEMLAGLASLIYDQTSESFAEQLGIGEELDEDFFESIAPEGGSVFDGIIAFYETISQNEGALEHFNTLIDDMGLSAEEAFDAVEVVMGALDEANAAVESISSSSIVNNLNDQKDAWDDLITTMEDSYANTEQLDQAIAAMNETFGAAITGISASSLESALSGGTDITELLSEGLRNTFAASIAESLYADVFSEFNKEVGSLYEEGGIDAVSEGLPDLIDSLDLEAITDSQEELDALDTILEELGLTASDAAEEIAGLSAATIKAAQAEIGGTSGEYELSQIAERFDWQEIFGGIPSEEEIRSGIDWVMGASTDQIEEMATQLGMSTSQFLDDILSLSDAFDSIDEAAADAADSTEDMAEALKDEIEALEETIGAMESLEDLMQNLAGAGDLAAVQSMEYFEKRYAQLLEEAQGGGEREVQNFTDFAETYLKYAQGYGDYEERVSDVMGDLEALENDIADGRTLSDLYDQLDVTNAELDQIQEATAATAQGMADALGEALEELMGSTTTPAWEEEGWSEGGITGLRDLFREAMDIGISGGLGSGFEMGEGWLGEGSGVDITQLSTGGYKTTLYGAGGEELASGYFENIEDITKSDVWELAMQSQEIMELWEGMFGPGGTEGYAGGGYATGLSIVGEKGPELVDFGSEGADVYSNEDSADIVSGSGGGETHITLQVDRKVLGKVIIEEAKYNKAFGKQIIKQIQAA